MRKSVNIIIPQYHSSICSNNCQYCSFRSSNTLVNRKRLSNEEFIEEVEMLIQIGYQTIEFVFSTDKYFTARRIADRIIIAKDLGNRLNKTIRIGLNADSLSTKEYKILKNADLDFFVLWMETYNQKTYSKVHPANTTKSDYNYRINAYERAIDAGLVNYGLGVLFGLHNWKEELKALIEHGNYLNKKFGIPPYIVGIPRLKDALNTNIGIFNQIIDNETYMYICKEIKLAFPNTMLFLNTRESLELNLQLLNGGNDLFTIDCKTFPGAYLDKNILNGKQEQFKTQCYNKKTALDALLGKGYTPKFEW